MKLYVQGSGALELADRDFLATGGEGRLYAKDGFAYKLYKDPTRTIPAAKIRELAVLDRENVIRPLALVLDARQQPVGYQMRRVIATVPLARLFTNEFRKRNGISPDATLRLVEAIQASIRFIHQRGCLLVDGNEMNYLVSETDFTRPWLIDVDSWQTPNFPATALMPSIRDWHSNTFSSASDWFSFAIVACQLFIGIHPYKGKHPRFKKHDLEARMKANVSIFNKEVSLPPATRDFGLIPSAWREWFQALFEHGRRDPPPQSAGRLGRAVLLAKSPSGAAVRLECLQSCGEDILSVFVWQGRRVIVNKRHFRIGSRTYQRPDPTAGLLFSPRSALPLMVYAESGRLQLHRVDTGEVIPCGLLAERILVLENRLYTLHGDYFSEIRITEIGNKLLFSPARIWNVLPHSVQVLQSLLLQNVLGRQHLLIPFRSGACAMLAVPELNGYKIVDGRWDSGVAILTAYRNGNYRRFILRLSPLHERYQLRTEDADTPAVQFVTLEQGIVVAVAGGGLEIFAADPARNEVNTVSLPPALVGREWTLAKDADRVLACVGLELYRLSLS